MALLGIGLTLAALIIIIIIGIVIIGLILGVIIHLLPALIVAGIVWFISGGNLMWTVLAFLAVIILMAIIRR